MHVAAVSRNDFIVESKLRYDCIVYPQHQCRTQVVAVCLKHACEPHTLYLAE